MREHIIGIALGLVSAALQSFSYLVSASYVREARQPGYKLLPPVFLVAGVASAVLLPFVKITTAVDVAAWQGIIVAGTMAIVLCMIGNLGMFHLQKYVEASRTTPMLILKVPILAAFYSFVIGGSEKCTHLQWLSVFMVVTAAVVLSFSGRKVTLKGWLWLIISCIGFSFSDYEVRHVIDLCAAPTGDNLLMKSLMGFVVTYICGGVISLFALPLSRGMTRLQFFHYALPYGALWFSAILILYFCFAISGVVLGNIVQSSRGLISVLLGAIVASHGRTDLEERTSLAVFLRRVFAAILIIGAMILWATAK